MVYSVMYYAFEAITKGILTFIIKLYEHAHPKRLIEEKPKKAEERPPSWGYVKVPGPQPEYRFLNRATKIRLSIPALIEAPIEAREYKAPPARLFFTFSEAASKDFFKEIERLAEYVEKEKRGGQ